MSNTYDPRLGTVHVTIRPVRRGAVSVPKSVAELIPTNVARVAHAPSEHQPCEYYLLAGALNSAVEREAARLGGLPVVLPEAAPWLSAKIASQTGAGRDVYLWRCRDDR